MRLYGYARASSADQSLEVQIDALLEAGVARPLIFAEKRTGTRLEGRDELHRCLELIDKGDVLIVTRIDRLARSLQDLMEILERLERHGVGFRCLQQPIDLTGPMGRLTMQIMGAFAEFETQLRKERQAEGIARAKAAGVYTGRRPAHDPSHIRQLRAEGLRPAEIQRRLNCSKSTVRRALSNVAQ